MKPATALTAIMLAGCASPAVHVPASEVDRLVTGLAAVARLPADAQRAELGTAAREFARDPGDYNRAWLGALHAVTRPPLRNDARAAELLGPLAASAHGDQTAPLAAFAVVLQEQLSARQRAARDGARRRDLLRQQLEALRDIERTNLQREQRVQERTR